MISFVRQIYINTPPSVIFQIYADIATWKIQNPEVERETLNG